MKRGLPPPPPIPGMQGSHDTPLQQQASQLANKMHQLNPNHHKATVPSTGNTNTTNKSIQSPQTHGTPGSGGDKQLPETSIQKPKRSNSIFSPSGDVLLATITPSNTLTKPDLSHLSSAKEKIAKAEMTIDLTSQTIRKVRDKSIIKTN